MSSKRINDFFLLFLSTLIELFFFFLENRNFEKSSRIRFVFFFYRKQFIILHLGKVDYGSEIEAQYLKIYVAKFLIREVGGE